LIVCGFLTLGLEGFLLSSEELSLESFFFYCDGNAVNSTNEGLCEYCSKNGVNLNPGF